MKNNKWERFRQNRELAINAYCAMVKRSKGLRELTMQYYLRKILAIIQIKWKQQIHVHYLRF